MDHKTSSKVVKVPHTGQISIGTQWAGKTVQVEEVAPGELRVFAVAVVPEHLATFFTPASKQVLDEFNEWQRTAPEEAAKETDLEELARDIKARRAKRASAGK
jgi:hypothetical protein